MKCVRNGGSTRVPVFALDGGSYTCYVLTLTSVPQVISYIGDNLKSVPATLGDPRNESPEAMAERHERVASSLLLALGSFVRLIMGDADSKHRSRADITQGVAGLLSQQGFWSRTLKAAQPSVRCSAYVMVAALVSTR